MPIPEGKVSDSLHDLILDAQPLLAAAIVPRRAAAAAREPPPSVLDLGEELSATLPAPQLLPQGWCSFKRFVAERVMKSVEQKRMIEGWAWLYAQNRHHPQLPSKDEQVRLCNANEPREQWLTKEQICGYFGHVWAGLRTSPVQNPCDEAADGAGQPEDLDEAGPSGRGSRSNVRSAQGARGGKVAPAEAELQASAEPNVLKSANATVTRQRAARIAQVPPKVAARHAAEEGAKRGAGKSDAMVDKDDGDAEYDPAADALDRFADFVDDVHEHEAFLRSTRSSRTARTLTSAQAGAVGGKHASGADVPDEDDGDELWLENDEQYEAG